MLVLSTIVNLIIALIPVFTGDTTAMICEESVCVEDGDITWLYFLVAFIKYPWILILYLQTGYWFNESGLAAKFSALKFDIDISLEASTTFQNLPSPLANFVMSVFARQGLIYWAVEFTTIVLAFYSFCNCTGDIFEYFYILPVTFIFLSAFRIFAFSCRHWFKDIQQRVKFSLWVDFLQDLIFNICVYVGTYGFVGIIFIIFPVLGYLETFSFLMG